MAAIIPFLIFGAFGLVAASVNKQSPASGGGGGGGGGGGDVSAPVITIDSYTETTIGVDFSIGTAPAGFVKKVRMRLSADDAEDPETDFTIVNLDNDNLALFDDLTCGTQYTFNGIYVNESDDSIEVATSAVLQSTGACITPAPNLTLSAIPGSTSFTLVLGGTIISGTTFLFRFKPTEEMSYGDELAFVPENNQYEVFSGGVQNNISAETEYTIQVIVSPPDSSPYTLTTVTSTDA